MIRNIFKIIADIGSIPQEAYIIYQNWHFTGKIQITLDSYNFSYTIKGDILKIKYLNSDQDDILFPEYFDMEKTFTYKKVTDNK